MAFFDLIARCLERTLRAPEAHTSGALQAGRDHAIGAYRSVNILPASHGHFAQRFLRGRQKEGKKCQKKSNEGKQEIVDRSTEGTHKSNATNDRRKTETQRRGQAGQGGGKGRGGAGRGSMCTVVIVGGIVGTSYLCGRLVWREIHRAVRSVRICTCM